jgi:hypothetical protein
MSCRLRRARDDAAAQPSKTAARQPEHEDRKPEGITVGYARIAKQYFLSRPDTPRLCCNAQNNVPHGRKSCPSYVLHPKLPQWQSVY